MKNSFTISKIDEINLKKYGLTLKEIKAQTKKMLDYILELEELKTSKVFDGTISRVRFDLSFCTDETIRTINRDYRNKDKATDVITFSLFVDDEFSIPIRKQADLGQIIVSIETADRQKEENNNTLKQEILTLICHGILHLLGFDHLEKKDYDFVVGVQKKVLKNYEQVSI